MEPWRAVDANNGGTEGPKNRAVEDLYRYLTGFQWSQIRITFDEKQDPDPQLS
jgi:hypothetical protein